MKTTELKEAYAFYKEQYPSGIILFRVDADCYELCYDDVKVVEHASQSSSLQIWKRGDAYQLCSKDLEHFIQCCSRLNIEVHIIVHVNREFFPKVKQILQDMEDDY